MHEAGQKAKRKWVTYIVDSANGEEDGNHDHIMEYGNLSTAQAGHKRPQAFVMGMSTGLTWLLLFLLLL